MDNDEYTEDGLALAAGIEVEERLQKKLAQHDDFNNLIYLLHKVDGFEPREKWIIPVLKSNTCQDFKTQLMTAIEDYEEG